ncbi:50S ribosomal protein L2 [bacterium]|nr:50S ribosomal protein L2 [bacterium]
MDIMKYYKPTTPSRRKASVVEAPKPVVEAPKSLKKGSLKRQGRSQGKVTVRHRGGGAKRLYRKVDFYQNKFDIPGRVESLEYDPNRTAWIALVVYKDGEKRYILAPDKIGLKTEIYSSLKKIEPKIGNRMPLKYIPYGVPIHNLELEPLKGGKLVRSAGSAAYILGIEGNYAIVKMPSGERRKINKECLATVGAVSNPENKNVRYGKAGRIRHLGIRPSVRGKAMNPVDHPHGGGEGHSPIGLKHPKTPWGKPALGVKTRKKKKWTNKFILQRRAKKKKKK